MNPDFDCSSAYLAMVGRVLEAFGELARSGPRRRDAIDARSWETPRALLELEPAR